MRKIYLYDTTLRDGSQTKGIDFSLNDKIAIIKKLDDFGIDYIEAGFPSANSIDDKLFANIPKTKNAKIVAFGMTHKIGIKAEEDLRLKSILQTKAKHACIFGKSSSFHVKEELRISLDENLKLIENSISFLASNKMEVIFDAEHFFDGYKENPKYALKVIEASFKNGARWISLCDTNGGSLPFEVFEIVKQVTKVIAGEHLAIHCHNDTENAVANSLQAVNAGVCQVQGTINGYGERCGNANLISIIPSLALKMGLSVGIKKLENLKELSDWFDNKLNFHHQNGRSYVGNDAFAHKGGVHGSAVKKNPKLYEHINPNAVGNEREVVISNQAGKASFLDRLSAAKINFEKEEKKLESFIKYVKDLNNKGYAYDKANASFVILAKKYFSNFKPFFQLQNFRVIVEKKVDANQKLITFSEAKVQVIVEDEVINTLEQGIGPVDALYKALYSALSQKFKVLKDISLVDYKVRIITPEKATEAITRVEVEFFNKKTKESFITIGVSENIIDASYDAVKDGFYYTLL